MKAGAASFTIVVASLLVIAHPAAARPVGALVFDSNRCDQGGHPGDGSNTDYFPCQESIFRVTRTAPDSRV